jgi:Protein of unknown function (DUF3105)
VAKRNERENQRRAVAEQLRKQQQRKERRRSLVILGACIVVVVGLLAAALVPYIKDQREKSKAEGTPVAQLGVSKSAADCDPVKTVDASGSGQHINPPKKINYPAAPPAFGPHWPNYLQGSELRSFYAENDRPEIERLVHSLEHGHTILWYDETVKPGTQAYKDVQAIGAKFNPETDKFMAAPWNASDGGSFPSGKHVALTHWTGPNKQKGATQYCAAPSGAVVDAFMKEFPASSAPEPAAP